ncbi:hypothetical protein COB21_00275 [Candidatus Aerophobetes bacterium]|uniref:PPM-type phosphatase domain-containing protein n=1 Tax=Aerophobetes bacterium TaxID=2030807 RepID=A0A2A4X8L2_UNCAE|nr:MAG: hypothetical protein COB21_00275 [Candidatus Aerophobetes bacterium]
MRFSRFQLSCYGLSDIGTFRHNNEDACMINQEQGLFILADGMGGHNAGEVAAKETVHFVTKSFETFLAENGEYEDIFSIGDFTKLTLENANSWVHHLGQKKKEYAGMGTTICTLLFFEKSIIYSHVGDSRIYRIRQGTIKQLTSDHSLKNHLVAGGSLKVAKNSLSKAYEPYKNILTKAIGTCSEIDIQVQVDPVMDNDIYLLCSDGLSDCLSPDEIMRVVYEHEHSKKSGVEKLIELAIQKGGKDNITAVLVQAKYHDPVDLFR